MTGGHEAVRRLLGAYVLGGIDDDDQATVDAHLSTCAECRAEVGRLAAVPELLQRLPPGPAAPLEPPSRAGLDALLRRARPRRLPVVALTALATACVVLALVAAVLSLRPVRQAQPQAQPSATAPAGTVVQIVAAEGSGLSGRATLVPRQWGVSVSLELAGLPGEGPYVMRVLGRGGQAEQAACWGRTTTAQARVTGASSIQLSNVDSITVSDHDGSLLGSARLA
ncbi:anti-sigma factor family protein [Dactylosporangium sp. NPDC048998]|uniref:anti-sigma factor family protein n=1 Tax=Dactylosporangium sp. NPDC048998 TaxID=3363976 RepID=UPI0037192D15